MAKKKIKPEEKIYNKVVKFATLRPRSEREITLWFKRKKVPQRRAKKLFNRLKNLGLINDRAFAAWWVESRVTFKPKGRRALFFELRQKGVATDVIESVLKSVEIPNEVALARDLVTKKLPRFKNLPPEARKKKLIGFLVRRGFSWETIRKVVDVHEADVVE